MWLNAGDKNETPNFHDLTCNPVIPQLVKDAKEIVSNQETFYPNIRCFESCNWKKKKKKISPVD